jgi:hypothetical protein
MERAWRSTELAVSAAKTAFEVGREARVSGVRRGRHEIDVAVLAASAMLRAGAEQ